MAPLDFEILSKLMRYVFTFLGALIVWRTYAWLRKDRRATHRRLKALPDAGTIGVMTVLRGSSELQEGAVIPVPFEGVLGFVRTCDVVVPVTDVVAQHLDFTFRNGRGLLIYPRRGCPVSVDGVTISSRADSHRHPMRHGSILSVGEALLQLGVFAGLEVGQAAAEWVSPAMDAFPAAPDGDMPPEAPQGDAPLPYPPQYGYALPFMAPADASPVDPTQAGYPPPCPPPGGIPPGYLPQGAYPPPYPPQGPYGIPYPPHPPYGGVQGLMQEEGGEADEP